MRTSDSTSKILNEMIQDSSEILSLLRCMTGENFEKEHWGMLFSILKIKNVTSAEKLLLSDILQSEILQKGNEIRDL